MAVVGDLLHQVGDFGFLVAENFVAPDEIEGQIFRHLGDPGGRISAGCRSTAKSVTPCANVSCTTSSARLRCSMPKIRVKVEIIFPAS